MLYIFKSPNITYTFRFYHPKVEVENNGYEKVLLIKSTSTVTLIYSSCSDPDTSNPETEQEFIIANDLSTIEVSILSDFSKYCEYLPEIK